MNHAMAACIFVIPVAALVKASRNTIGCGQRQQPFSLDIERPHRCHRSGSRRSRFSRRRPACSHASGAQPRHFAPNVSITSIRGTIWALNSGRSSAGILLRRAGLSGLLGSRPTRISAPCTESVKQKGSKARPRAADIPPMSPISSAFPSVRFPNAQDSGRAALATSSQQLSQDAQQIANPATENLTNPLLDTSQPLLLTQAGADVIRTSNEMLGTLLNVHA